LAKRKKNIIFTTQNCTHGRKLAETMMQSLTPMLPNKQRLEVGMT
jgi:hypothetical protein